MNNTSKKKERHCCSLEKQRLVEELRRCDFCTSSYDEFHQCYSNAARASGERSRSCITRA